LLRGREKPAEETVTVEKKREKKRKFCAARRDLYQKKRDSWVDLKKRRGSLVAKGGTLVDD